MAWCRDGSTQKKNVAQDTNPESEIIFDPNRICHSVASLSAMRLSTARASA